MGTISKQWAGVVKELFTQADNFGVSCTLTTGVSQIISITASIIMCEIDPRRVKETIFTCSLVIN